MAGVFFFIVSCTLLAAFLGVRAVERRRGARFFPELRDMLDDAVLQAQERIDGVHVPTLLRSVAAKGSRKVLHDALSGALSLVRSTERILTRFVRHLRRSRALEEARKGEPSGHIAAMHEAKQGVERTPQE